MVARFFLLPSSLPFIAVFPSHSLLFPKPSLSKLAIVSLFSATPQALSPKSLPYGPSLKKGKAPSGPKLFTECIEDREIQKQGDPGGDSLLSEEEFTRVFDIAALRVPAKDCFALESRLRGHLLNWPRIRNIARVPGDEVEDELVSLLGYTKNGEKDEQGKLDVLNRRIYGKAEGDGEELSPVLYRERLAKEFNSRGFVRFRNLAKISRPKRKRKEGKEEKKKERNGRRGKNEFAVVEVVEEEEEGENWRGLLGDEFKGRSKWRGSTRLLLLDEMYAEKTVEELPQAIKVAKTYSLDDL